MNMVNTVVHTSLTLTAPGEKVFDSYVNQMDEWWPLMGDKVRRSFATGDQQPKHIRFEAGQGGRYYEVFADGSEYTIGHITVWEPNKRLSYTWKDPDWNTETLIEVSFQQMGNLCLVTLIHSGWEALDNPEEVTPYHFGSPILLSSLKRLVEEGIPYNA